MCFYSLFILKIKIKRVYVHTCTCTFIHGCVIFSCGFIMNLCYIQYMYIILDQLILKWFILALHTSCVFFLFTYIQGQIVVEKNSPGLGDASDLKTLSPTEPPPEMVCCVHTHIHVHVCEVVLVECL